MNEPNVSYEQLKECKIKWKNIQNKLDQQSEQILLDCKNKMRNRRTSWTSGSGFNF